MTTTLDLTVDRDRLHASTRPKSGIRVRAKCGDRMGVFDIEALDRDSLFGYLTDESKLIAGLRIYRDT